jgi:hypothetical protein
MTALRKDLRSQLETTILAARAAAEAGGREALKVLGVHEGKAPDHLKPADKALRNRLRACGRQAGDIRDERTGQQPLEHLVGVVAYEHWHRMLFARFLAENGLLLEPGGVSVSLADVAELARDAKVNVWELAGRFAQRMLPAVFRADDPVLALIFAPEHQKELEKLVADLPTEVFLAQDSLGWTYQFWQAHRKQEVNDSGNKIGADELPAVTQLFTEDYMVDFLLDNTLGAWWAGKKLNHRGTENTEFKTEEEVRQFCALPGCPWQYLRFIKRDDGQWTPAAGTFDGWPKTAAALRALDPCMGSGHFVVAMFERLVALRMAEEKLDAPAAVAAVIRDNLFGLELDPRCTQIGAFNLALAAWRRVGHCALPAMNLACSGLAPNTREADWLALAGDNEKLRSGMERLHRLFKNAPVLGSLINPRAGEGDLLVAAFHELQPLLEKALAQEAKDDTAHEMAVTARGLAKAAEILAGQFTLVATNVPYLGYKKQEETLKRFCENNYPDTKHNLATCILERSLEFCSSGGSTALVTPHNLLFAGSYLDIRLRLLKATEWTFVGCVGPKGFQTPMYDLSIVLLGISNRKPSEQHRFPGIDAAELQTPDEKADCFSKANITSLAQSEQLRNPDARITLGAQSDLPMLQEAVTCQTGILNGDSPKFQKFFWEFPTRFSGWAFQQSTVARTIHFGGRELVIFYDEEQGHLREDAEIRRSRLHDSDQRGNRLWGKRGLVVHRMGTLPVTLYSGEIFDQAGAVIVPNDDSVLAAVWCFVSSEVYAKEVRLLDNNVGVTPATLAKVSFDLMHWQKVAAEKYPHGLPQPFSSDPTQ